MENQNSKIIVIGAGLAGLSAAYHGADIVYEKEANVGGMCHSPKVCGYTFDYGIHVLHSTNKYVLKLLKDDLRVNLPSQTRNAWIYSYNTFTRYPIQANTYGLPVSVVKKCLIDFIKVHGNVQKEIYANYEDWILSTFGEGFGCQFLIPYSDKFWTVPAKDLTADWLDIRIPRPSIDDVIEGALTDQIKGFGPNASFMYPEGDGGIGAIPRAFETGLLLLKKPILLNKMVCEVDIKNKKLTFLDGSTDSYLKLISTIPLQELIKILKPYPHQEIKVASDKLKHNSILCVNLGLKGENINPNHWIYYVEKEFTSFRISFLKNFSIGLTPNGRSSISAEISYSGQKEFSKSDVIERTILDLKKGGIIESIDDVELKDVRDIKYGYVIYDHQRRENVNIIKDYLSKFDIITAGRYGSWEYQWMDDAILDGKRAIEEAKNSK